MSDQWRILVVVDEEDLNRSIVSSLNKDGYFVRGVASGAEAIRALLGEQYDVVIGDLKAPGADGFELIQWLRMYRPSIHMIMIAAPGLASIRTQALESGVVSYLEKPLNLHMLKEEIRRLLQQTGFSASLDSFDLLDVIQIITMSRRNIALLVNTGVEGRGVLRFQNGELIWAEYGVLRGEEAFFALAAYKNGTVSHQPWNEQIVPNVTQPLSRLILKALQYRSKYAQVQQASSEFEAIVTLPQEQEPIDDTPFQFFAESVPQESVQLESTNVERTTEEPVKEWWQETRQVPSVGIGSEPTRAMSGNSGTFPPFEEHPAANSGSITPLVVHKTPASQRNDLPSWLTDQPTRADIPPVPPPLYPDASQVLATPPANLSSSTGWPSPAARSTEQAQQKPLSTDTGIGLRRISSPEWQAPEHGASPPSGPLQSLVASRKAKDALLAEKRQESGVFPAVRPSDPAWGESTPPGPSSQPERYQGYSVGPMTGLSEAQRLSRRNNTAIVTALQTLGYSIPGFIATAVVGMDGQPIAQVSVDELDLSLLGRNFSQILQGVLFFLDQGSWGAYEDLVITSANQYILLRLVGDDRSAFQVLVTTREADPVESLEVMANVEGAIAVAL